DAIGATARLFVIAAVAGALGGWSTLASPSLSAYSMRLPIPRLLELRARFYSTLDRITHRPAFGRLSPVRALFYDAALAVCGLSALTLALDGATLLLAHSISLTYLSAATSLVAALLIAAPFLWLALAFIATAVALLPVIPQTHRLNPPPGATC